MHRLAKIIFLFGFGILGACSQKSDSISESTDSNQMSSMVKVSAVSLEGDGAAGLVKVTADKEPKYNVFKLTEPDRIVIDLIDAKLEEGIPASITGQGSVKEVRVQGLEDSLSALVRVEIVLANGMNYLASVDGTSLNIRLMGAEGAPTSETPIAETPMAESTPAPMAEAAPLPLPIPEVAPAPIPVPVPEAVTEAPMPEPQVEAKSETSEMKMAEVAPLAPPAPMPEPAPAPMTEIAPAPIPVPMPEITKEDMGEKTVADREKPALPALREIGNGSVKKIKTQEIPTSGLSEGTSLLTELDTKVYTGKRVSLEFQNADVQDVIRLVAEVSKLNIIVADDVKGNLTLKLVDVPWDQALDIILTTLSLDKVQHGNILRVAPAEKLKKERETALANDKAAKQLEPLRLKLININYAKGDEMSSRIKNLLSDRGTVDVDPRTNTLIVKDIKEHISRIENLVKVLDTQTPQVRIESRIVQANDSFARNIGVQWGPTLNLNETADPNKHWRFPIAVDGKKTGETGTSNLANWAVDALSGSKGSTLGFRLGSITNVFNLDLRLSYAETNSMARVISRPSVSVLDNRTARIIQGSKIPFLTSGSDGANVSFQEAGIEISVTPQITNDGSVIMKVATKSNEPGSGDIGGNKIINIREASTEMLVKSGRTSVLGGVFKTTETDTQSGVPGLKDIPILGWLFKGTDKTRNREELLIFITPYILTDVRTAQNAPSSDTALEP